MCSLQYASCAALQCFSEAFRAGLLLIAYAGLCSANAATSVAPQSVAQASGQVEDLAGADLHFAGLLLIDQSGHLGQLELAAVPAARERSGDVQPDPDPVFTGTGDDQAGRHHLALARGKSKMFIFAALLLFIGTTVTFCHADCR